MNQRKKISLLIIFLIGLVVPFIPAVMFLELFFLVVPFVILFTVSLIYLVVSHLKKQTDRRKALFNFLLLPTFIIAQVLGGFSVDQIQRWRSDQIISDLNQIKLKTGKMPEKYEPSLGIKYTKLNDEKHFKLEYSRGFMVTEKYNSENGNWKSYGWND